MQTLLNSALGAIMVNLSGICGSGTFAVAPDILLTGGGARPDCILYVQNGEIAFAGSRKEFECEFPRVTPAKLPGKAVVPGFIDAHTHLGQAFGKAITGGEPAQIWRRIWGSYGRQL